MPCLQSYMTENMSYFGSFVNSFSGTQLSSSQQMLTLYSAINWYDSLVSMPARRSWHMDLYHAAGQGHSKAFIKNVDSGRPCNQHISAAETFSAVDRIWNRKNMQKYSNPSHFANQMLGPQHCEVLPFFHDFTGCDLVSSMLSAKSLHGMLGMLILRSPTPLSQYSKIQAGSY